MPELPKISGNQAIKIVARLGFRIARQKGSHVVLRKDNHGCVVPIHKELAAGTLRSDIAARAIADYLDLQEYQIRSIKEAVEEADSPHAKFLEHAEVVKRMKKLDHK